MKHGAWVGYLCTMIVRSRDRTVSCFYLPLSTSIQWSVLYIRISSSRVWSVMDTYRGVARLKNVRWTHMASAKCEPITGVWAKPPWSWKPFSFWMPNGSSKFASFSVFWKLPKPQVFVIHLSKKLKVLSTMAWTILCINRKTVWNCTACDVWTVK